MPIYLTKCEIVQECEYHSIIKDNKSLKKFLDFTLDKYKTIKECVAIVHDKDVTTKSNGEIVNKAIHFHIYLKFNTSIDIDWLSKVFMVEPQYINKIKGSWTDCLAYAIHLNAPNKYQYDKDELLLYNVTPNDYDKEISKIDIDDKKIKNALYDYGDLKISKSVLMRDYINTSELYNKYDKLFKKMQEYRILKGRERNMKVVWISGESGTGKTTLAKYLAVGLNYDYFVSGSGSDVLDGYDKEECIILDDLRADNFEPSELFKLLDNNTNSSVKSRFKNKDISNCKLLVITSVFTPFTFYNWYAYDKAESFTQLARRLDYSFVELSNDIIVGRIIDKKEPFNHKLLKSDIFPYDMRIVYESMNIIKSTNNILDIIKSVKIGDKKNEK